MARKPYSTDVSDDEWAFVAPHLWPEEAGQRRHDPGEVFNGPRHVIKGGVTWPPVLNDLPPLEIVYQQTQRRLRAGLFEAMVQDLRLLLRTFTGDRQEFRVWAGRLNRFKPWPLGIARRRGGRARLWP